jgi:hypothetical protein
VGEQGERAPIPIEPRVARESKAGDVDSGPRGNGGSTGRVVHEPGGWPRLAAVLAVVGLVAGGLLWAIVDDRGSPAQDEEPASEPSAPPGDRQAETRREFAAAMLRFEEVQSFSYSGSVRATTTRPFGSGAFAVGDLTVEGAVLLRPALVRQVAADASGRAGETLTSGTTVWTRSAPSTSTLEAAPWTVRAGSPDSAGTGLDAPHRLDMQLVAHLMTMAGNPRGEAPDTVGRRVIRATLPTRGDGEGNLLPLAGADVLLSLDDAGNIAHLVVTWPPHEPQLVLDVEISGHNQPQDIAPPDRGRAAVRRTVPVEALEAEGFRPLELGHPPAGWRLTGAWVGIEVTPRAECQALTLVYGDPDAGSGRYLWLMQSRQECGILADATGEPQPLVVGAFEGSFAVSSTGTVGALFDGTTAIRFVTDLPIEDVETLLASLQPFDPDADPVG